MSQVRGQFVVIQYLRGIAALLIVWLHATDMTAVASKNFMSFGHFGVDIFFVISGFIMWTTSAHQTRTPVGFWLQRIVRVVPLYWTFIFLFIAGLLAVPEAVFNNRTIDPLYVLKSLFFVPAIDPLIGAIIPIYAPGWTLNYEMFFYFVFGLSLLVPNLKLRAAAVIIGFAALVSIGYLADFQNVVLATYTHPVLLEFVAGLCLACNIKRFERAPLSIAALFSAAAVGLFAIGEMVSPAACSFYSGAGATLLVAAGLVVERIARGRVSGVAKFIGDASYSIYLAHPFAQRAFYLVAGQVVGTAVILDWYRTYIVGALIVGTIGGCLSYILIERPLLRLSRRRRSEIDRRGPAASALENAPIQANSQP